MKQEELYTREWVVVALIAAIMVVFVSVSWISAWQADRVLADHERKEHPVRSPSTARAE